MRSIASRHFDLVGVEVTRLIILIPNQSQHVCRSSRVELFHAPGNAKLLRLVPRNAGHSRAPIPKSTNAASPTDLQADVACQFTFGPELFHAPGNGFGRR